MKPTRRTQPYRKYHGRQPGPSLAAMLNGKPLYMPNPQDAHRARAKHLADLLREMRRRGR